MQKEKAAKFKFNPRWIAMTAMLAAMSSVLMFVELSVPLVPSFIKLDISELPALVASFSMGPISGIIVCLIKNLIHLTQTSTTGVGEFCNFLLGICFVLPAGLIYSHRKNRKSAIIGCIVGAAAMAVCSLPINYYITYPFYANFMSMSAIVGMYKAILPSVDSLFECLLVFNVPFTLFKGLLVSLITILIYKRISPIIKGRH